MLDPAVKAIQFAQAAVSEFDESETVQRTGLRSRSLVCIACWIGASFVMIAMNKWLYRQHSFPFPVFLTCLQMVTSFLCCAFLMLFNRLKPQLVGESHHRDHTIGFDVGNEQFQTDAVRVVSAGMFYALSLSCGSVAYLYLTVPCMQMMKASLPVFTLIFMFRVGLEKYSWRYLQIVSLICGGLIIYLLCLLATAGHENDLRFSPMGFVLQAVGIFADCMRLTFLNLLVGRRKNASNHEVLPILLGVSMVAAIALGCVWGVLEAPQFDWSAITAIGPTMLLANCVWGFVVTWTVFMLVRETSALVLTLGGLIKNVIVISISRVVAHANSASATQALGYALALFGVYAFLEFKKNPHRFRHGLLAGMMHAWFNHTQVGVDVDVEDGSTSSSIHNSIDRCSSGGSGGDGSGSGSGSETRTEVSAFDSHIARHKQQQQQQNRRSNSNSKAGCGGFDVFDRRDLVEVLRPSESNTQLRKAFYSRGNSSSSSIDMHRAASEPNLQSLQSINSSISSSVTVTQDQDPQPSQQSEPPPTPTGPRPRVPATRTRSTSKSKQHKSGAGADALLSTV